MIKITRGGIGWDKIKRWVNKRIRIPDSNTLAGKDAGKVVTGNYNTIIGANGGYALTTANANVFIGHAAGYANTTGHSNLFIGSDSGHANVDGNGNTFLGLNSGYGCITGNDSVFVGQKAGFYETGDYKLFIDNAQRANEADGRVKALIYGVFDAATANQRLSINAQLLIREVATYVDDAAAGVGGLVTNEIYKHADGSLHIKL